MLKLRILGALAGSVLAVGSTAEPQTGTSQKAGQNGAATKPRGSSFSEPTKPRATPATSGARRPADAVAGAIASARAAGATPVPSPVPLAAAPAGGSGYTGLGWDVLAGYKYKEPVPAEGSKPQDSINQRPKNQIPPSVLAYKGKKVEVEGWMVPTEVDDSGGVKSFILVRTQPQCCFGDTQSMNEWIEVKLKGRTTDVTMDRPIRVRGTIDVGELTEDGFVLSIYRMAGDRVEL